MCPKKVENPPFLRLIEQAVKVMKKRILSPVCIQISLIECKKIGLLKNF
jgi:hypothetical protein